ncbi:glycosyltransferase family 2 protein [Chloroflexota bacterium]
MKENQYMASSAQPSISIITTSYTEKRLQDLVELLASIHDQTYHNIETLVVTERSLDLHDSIKKHISKSGYDNVHLLYNKGEWGSYSARNLGIEQAQGEIIAFIDDDAVLFPDWAKETAAAYMEDDSVIGLTGPILPLWEDNSMSWFPKELYWIFSCTYWDWQEKTEVRNGYGTNISFRREAYDCCGLFKNSLEGEEKGKSDWQRPGAKETEFSMRVTQKMGKRILYNPRTRVRHKVYRYRLSTGFMVRRAYWEGYAKAWLDRLYPSGADRVLATEYDLLRRIFLNLFPRSLWLLLRQPVIALRQLWVTTLVLSCVATGFLSYHLSRVFGWS